MISVLFVDDDKIAQKIVKEILGSAGYSVVTLGDPRDALDRLNSETFDIILTDANIPGGVSGFDFVKTLRSTEKFSKIPIAMITGRRDKKDIQFGLECGADDYIIKPIDPMILLGKVDSLLKKKTGIVVGVKFPEGPVRQKAKWNLEIEIIYISERGLILSSTVIADEDTRLRINSDFFAQIGIEPPLLRIASCTRDPFNIHLHQIKANFIGLTDTDLQKVRAWLNVKFSPTKKAG